MKSSSKQYINVINNVINIIDKNYYNWLKNDSSTIINDSISIAYKHGIGYGLQNTKSIIVPNDIILSVSSKLLSPLSSDYDYIKF